MAEATDPVVQAVDSISNEAKNDNVNPELNEHIKNLVGLYFDQCSQQLDERIRDLELLVGQAHGAVQFVPTRLGHNTLSQDGPPGYPG